MLLWPQLPYMKRSGPRIDSCETLAEIFDHLGCWPFKTTHFFVFFLLENQSKINKNFRTKFCLVNPFIPKFFIRTSTLVFISVPFLYFLKISEKYQRVSLREKCPNTGFFLVRIFPDSDWIRRDTLYLSVFSPNPGKCGPEKTRYLDTFHAVFWWD